MLRQRLFRLGPEESGSVSIETLFIFPILFWCYLGSFAFFDGFRAVSSNVKVTYTLADILSREVNEPVTPEYLDSLFALYGALSNRPAERQLRVTVVRYLLSDDSYHVVWSQGRGGAAPQTDAGLAALRDEHLPAMYDGEVGIIVETTQHYTPLLHSTPVFPLVSERDMAEFTIMRPRFAPRLCWSESNDGPWTIDNQTC